MELKDVILSTLAEMDEEVVPVAVAKKEDFEIKETRTLDTHTETVVEKEELSPQAIDSEQIFLHSIRERLLVLFEGFQAPNNANIEAKVDMTLNFLEYTLATIDSRLEKLDKGSH
jgi:predicted nucleotidyltransferase component of viral defense system